MESGNTVYLYVCLETIVPPRLHSSRLMFIDIRSILHHHHHHHHHSDTTATTSSSC